MVKSTFSFFKMQEELFVVRSIEFREVPFSIASERFNTVDVQFSSGKFIFMMKCPIAILAVQNQVVIRLSTIRMHY